MDLAYGFVQIIPQCIHSISHERLAYDALTRQFRRVWFRAISFDN
jgi:hypothetical protein